MAGKTIFQEEEEGKGGVIVVDQQQSSSEDEPPMIKHQDLYEAEDPLPVFEAWRRRRRRRWDDKMLLNCINEIKPHIGTLHNVNLEITLLSMIDKLLKSMDKTERIAQYSQQLYLVEREKLTRIKNNKKKRITQLQPDDVDEDNDRKRTRTLI